MAKRTRNKKSKPVAEPVESSEDDSGSDVEANGSEMADNESEMDPEVLEVVKAQVAQQNVSALTNGFAQSAAFFSKKPAYVSAPAPSPAKIQAKAAASKDAVAKQPATGKKKAKKEKSLEAEEKQQQQQEKTDAGSVDESPEAIKARKIEKKKLRKQRQKAAATGVESADVNKEETKSTDEKKTEKKAEKKTKQAENTKKEAEKQTEKSSEDEEKDRRTVFVGNVSLDATNKDLQRHFAPCGKVESVRLRYLPIAGCAVDQPGNQKLMMKVCANKKILSAAKDNCNAYVTFVSEDSVEAALKLTGSTLVLKKIRVDRAVAVMDHRRSVFVGNLPFKCTDEQMALFFTKKLRTEEEPEPVENVRLIRDRESGLGKGFGYILLKTPALVAKALTLRNTKMEARELRLQVCGKRFKNKRGEEDTKEKFEGLRASPGAHARIQLKRKVRADAEERAVSSKKVKRAAAAAGLGKNLKPKHAARKAAAATGQNLKGKKPGRLGKKRGREGGDKAKTAKPKVKKPKHAARKARQAAEAAAKQ